MKVLAMDAFILRYLRSRVLPALAFLPLLAGCCPRDYVDLYKYHNHDQDVVPDQAEDEKFFLQVRGRGSNVSNMVLWGNNDIFDNGRDGFAAPVFFVDTIRVFDGAMKKMTCSMHTRNFEFFERPVPRDVYSTRQALEKGLKPLPKKSAFIADSTTMFTLSFVGDSVVCESEWIGKMVFHRIAARKK